MAIEDKMKHSRREFARLAAPLLAMALLPGAGPLVQPRIQFNAQQREDLDKVSAYLNSIRTMAAGFAQMNEKGGITQGTFYLSRPGRLRFEYRPPTPTLVVATGGKIYVRNSRLNTVEPYSVQDAGPLLLLLGENVDLRRNPNVMGIERRPGELLLRARTSPNRTQDNINIVFATEPQLTIRSWTIRDAQGGTTSVSFSQPQLGVALPDELFAVPVKTPVIRPGGK